MGNGCGKHAWTNSIYCPSHNAVHENRGFALSAVVDRVLQQGPEIWAQFLSCSECWIHPVCCWWPNTFHGMGDIANILLGKSTLWGNPTPNCENGWVTSCWPHLDLQFRYIFCGARLTETENTEVQYCIDPTASDLEWKVSFPHHSWSLKKQAVHRGSHSDQCAAYLVPW